MTTSMVPDTLSNLTKEEFYGCEQLIFEMELVEGSQFYDQFLKEVQSPPISKHLRRILGSESKMQMVIYGIGSLSESNSSIMQLSLALLMRKHLNWIGEIEVFDPILSSTEIKVLEVMGCCVLKHNEEARRQAIKPTIFFMPHCDDRLYNNLLEANWEANLLRNVIIFGNSFDSYIERVPDYSRDFSPDSAELKLHIWENKGHILAAETFTNEFKMSTIYYSERSHRRKRTRKTVSKRQMDYDYSFNDLCWHFFSPLTETWMGLMRWHTKKELGVGGRNREFGYVHTTNASSRD